MGRQQWQPPNVVYPPGKGYLPPGLPRLGEREVYVIEDKAIRVRELKGPRELAWARRERIFDRPPVMNVCYPHGKMRHLKEGEVYVQKHDFSIEKRTLDAEAMEWAQREGIVDCIADMARREEAALVPRPVRRVGILAVGHKTCANDEVYEQAKDLSEKRRREAKNTMNVSQSEVYEQARDLSEKKRREEDPALAALVAAAKAAAEHKAAVLRAKYYVGPAEFAPPVPPPLPPVPNT